MKDITLFQRLKAFINDVYADWSNDAVNWHDTFTTKQMRKMIGEYEKPTYWKMVNNNPNYVLHCYLGELHTLGCITRVKHGVYRVNAPIPSWFGSLHFKGLQGYLNDPSNFYWNSLPEWQKVNPWAKPKQNRIEDVCDAWPELQAEESIDTRIAAMEQTIIDSMTEINSIRKQLTKLKALAEKLNKPQVLSFEEWTNQRWTISYDNNEWVVTRNVDKDGWTITTSRGSMPTPEQEKQLRVLAVKYLMENYNTDNQ